VSFAIAPRLDLRQTQTLVMTPQLQQAIKLLQFSNLEAAAFVEEELERNPLLERADPSESNPLERPAPDQVLPAEMPAPDAAAAAASDELPAEAPVETPDHAEPYDPGGAGDGVAFGRGGNGAFEADERTVDDFAAPQRTLREQLTEQLHLDIRDPTERLIGATMIAALEPSGRLPIDDAALANALGTEVALVASVRERMMRFEPTGMFARDLRQCLAVQQAERNRLDPAMQALLDNLDLLARHDHRRLMVICGVDAADLADMIAEIRHLDPKPGVSFDSPPLVPVVPDVLMRAAPDGGWVLELNPETMPRVLLRQGYSAQMLTRATRQERAFFVEKLQSAAWLVKALQQRAQTILKVATEIVRQQDGFFRHGVDHLRPLILRDIAAAVDMHESTVSRVTAGKYIATPRGIYDLKYFFTTAIAGTTGESHSAEAVRHRIKGMVGAEQPGAVLSDDAIVANLRREGVDIARRTVAKYREALHIPSSVQRKREKAMPA
jgi:RNA polymerase sigma-54 factor